eukprot:TRINITY_DN4068_c0_g1_i2.p1 TRINITY_DN4068_c0_g1~~TRINITY_DN4068_c0_g1_i2.p1  ORF type:complete len:430 (-),score=87.23 TRINITY_DN4068_c0_g1_i2:192-1481(-)
MRISFGKNQTAWNNAGIDQVTPLVQELSSEIARFGTVLKIINKLELLFIFLPIWLVLFLFRFSSRFGNYMVYPLTALFFGTGNQTPYVSSAIVSRVFLDPDLRLFQYDRSLLLSSTPLMYAFPPLRKIYESWSARCESTGAVRFLFNTPVGKVRRTKSPTREGAVEIEVTSANGDVSKKYDYIIFACDAETVLKLLEGASFMEKFVLGNVRYYDDVTLTHTDRQYMREHYQMGDEEGQRNTSGWKDAQYFIHVDEAEPWKLEMSFNLSNYQPQLKERKDKKNNDGESEDIYQTIFLDANQKQNWTINKIRPEKVLLTKWWRQFAHTWKHFVSVIPFVRFIQGSFHQSTFYCGSYTLMNTHEIAIISGLAAAQRLGAPYPFGPGFSIDSFNPSSSSSVNSSFSSAAPSIEGHDRLAHEQYAMYLKFIHGV